MLLKILRRARQFSEALFSPEFSSTELLIDKMVKRYSTPIELDFYESQINHGLEEEEHRAALSAFKAFQGCPTVLVVGCGVGREAFALEKMGFKVLAIDSSEAMILRALSLAQRVKSRVVFRHGDVFTLSNINFDFLFVTPGIIGHIPTQTNRVDFLKKLNQLGNPNCVLFCLPEIRELTPLDTHFWGSQLLRFRWRGKNLWSPGDTISSFLGNHNKDSGLLYYHYYPSYRDFESELQLSGFNSERNLQRYVFTRSHLVSNI